MGERELDALKSELETLADHLDGLNADIDAECVADILSDLAHGATAAGLIDKYGLIDDEPGV
jgi:hypothetical protein